MAADPKLTLNTKYFLALSTIAGIIKERPYLGRLVSPLLRTEMVETFPSLRHNFSCPLTAEVVIERLDFSKSVNNVTVHNVNENNVNEEFNCTDRSELSHGGENEMPQIEIAPCEGESVPKEIVSGDSDEFRPSIAITKGEPEIMVNARPPKRLAFTKAIKNIKTAPIFGTENPQTLKRRKHVSQTMDYNQHVVLPNSIIRYHKKRAYFVFSCVLCSNSHFASKKNALNHQRNCDKLRACPHCYKPFRGLAYGLHLDLCKAKSSSSKKIIHTPLSRSSSQGIDPTRNAGQNAVNTISGEKKKNTQRKCPYCNILVRGVAYPGHLESCDSAPRSTWMGRMNNPSIGTLSAIPLFVEIREGAGPLGGDSLTDLNNSTTEPVMIEPGMMEGPEHSEVVGKAQPTLPVPGPEVVCRINFAVAAPKINFSKK